ncbi:hypothetical protein PHMEG_00025510 [Phytophthora megakarya]|uniref:Uncharacterized protein n=1 Tax=Phytophthora megakarya TaxID=4795 RepID=A0A225VD38_9STRA|nr:hypothetical protein PHMEG_00025510 [Phytophthora megakarya]
MTGPRHVQKKAGRGDGGPEDESLRRSRRKQGLPPLEYKDLDVVVQESRATKKAAQDAQRAVDRDQPVSEPAAGDDQALSNVASPEAPLSESGTTRVEGESTRDESAQTSVGGADMVEPPVEEMTPKPGQDVDVEPLEEKAPPAVKVEPEVQELTADDSVPESEYRPTNRRAKKSPNRPESRKCSTGKAREDPGSPPSDPGDDSDSSSDDGDNSDSSSSGSEDSLDNDDGSGTATTKTTKDGTTAWNFRPYINYNAVEKFDDTAPNEDRVNWWERFTDMAAQGSWPDEMKIRQFRSRMPATIRDWNAQLPKSTRHNW